MFRDVDVTRVWSESERAEALTVLDEVYCREQGWAEDAEALLPLPALKSEAECWYLARVRNQPAGVLRIRFDLPVELWRGYSFEKEPGWTDLGSLVTSNRVAELGRFAVRRSLRRHPAVAMLLLREAVTEVVRRGGSHLLTDVFEGDRHNPLRFLRRTAGFLPIATHRTGELNSPHRRVAMVMDLREAYLRAQVENPALFRRFTRQWSPDLHRLLR